MMNLRLFEVKKDVYLNEDYRMVLHKGERVMIHLDGPNGFPTTHGFDIAFEPDEFEEYFEEVK